MWEIMSSGSLEHRWSTPINWDRSKEEEEVVVV